MCSQSRRSVLMHEAHSAHLEVRNRRRLAVAAPAAHLALECPPVPCAGGAAGGLRRWGLVVVPPADSSPGRRRCGPGCNKCCSRLVGISFRRRRRRRQQQRLPWRQLLLLLLLLRHRRRRRRCLICWVRLGGAACVSCLGGALADRHPCEGVLFAAGVRGGGAGRSLMPCTGQPG
jgi:hypothetical protein